MNAHNVQPDIIFRRTEAGFTVEMTRNYESMLVVAPLWKKLAERGNTSADETMRNYIREHVERAQSFVTGLTRRGMTLRRIAAAPRRASAGLPGDRQPRLPATANPPGALRAS